MLCAVSMSVVQEIILPFIYTGIIDHYEIICKKIKAVSLQARCGPEGSRRFRRPDFHDIQHMKVVRVSASRTGRLYP
jgi:hypothetical protein